MRVDERWPDLFEGMDERIREAVVQAVATNTSENWEPDYVGVKLLCDQAAGRITLEEYKQRVRAAALHRVASERSANVERQHDDHQEHGHVPPPPP